MIGFFKSLIPAPLISAYHLFLSWLAAVWYGHPSRELRVIGVTGTNGKSTVVNLTAQILRAAGFKVGFTSTVSFDIAGRQRLNPLKMTMPGRFFLQKMLRAMADAGCDYAIIESTSEGILQHRQRHIRYDCMVFTNLAPEHLERHGGLENYTRAKLEYFRYLESLPPKILGASAVPKVIVVNLDDKQALRFLDFRVARKLGFTRRDLPPETASFPQVEILRGSREKLSASGTGFSVEGVEFTTPFIGDFNIENCLAAIACAKGQGVDLEVASRSLASAEAVPGRLESISEGQEFIVVVDYAPEPNALAATYEALKLLPKTELIHILGSTGGGRDRARRAVLGEMAGTHASTVIVTNEDPYDDDPQTIIDDVASGALKAGKRLGRDLHKIIDRREAIKKALSLARPESLVLITGKGAEQAIVAGNGRKIPWDDRTVARQELKKLLAAAKSGRGL